MAKRQEKKTEIGKLPELKKQIVKAKEELFGLQLDLTQRKLKNTSSLTLKRKEIARLLTALRTVELTENL